MTKANKMTDVHQSPESGLGKTFLIGVATWPVLIGCLLAGQKRPAWLTKEFAPSTRELKNICFAFGLATGGIAVTGSIYGVGQLLVDEYLAPSKQVMHHSAPAKAETSPSPS